MSILILVPYRDREAHLAEFYPALVNYFTAEQTKATIAIVEQGDELFFNRGALINAGFLLLAHRKPTHLCFHDVDCVPIKSDYSYSEYVTLLHPREAKGNWFSPVVMCPTDLFKSSNGFSNEYWGWGSEDSDFYIRTKSDLRIKKDTIYKDLWHEHSSLKNGIPRPECMKNHMRLNSMPPNDEGLSTCKFAIIENSRIETTDFVDSFRIKVDLTCLHP